MYFKNQISNYIPNKRIIMVMIILLVFGLQQLVVLDINNSSNSNKTNAASSSDPFANTNNANDLIITFGKDTAISQAVSELEFLNPGITLVQYNPNTFAQQILNVKGELYLVGHGNPSGMVYHSHILPWTQLVLSVRSSPSSFIGFVACYSAAAMKYAVNDLHITKIAGLMGQVEPILGALLMFTIKVTQLHEKALLHTSQQLLLKRMNQVDHLPHHLSLSDFLTPTYWNNLAENRLGSSSQSTYSNSIKRGVIEAGSYASIFQSYPQFYWAGMAAWVVISVNIAKYIMAIIDANPLDLICGITCLSSLSYGTGFGSYFGNIISPSKFQSILTIMVPLLQLAFIAISGIPILGLLSSAVISYIASNFISEFQDLENVIYKHALWSYLAFILDGSEGLLYDLWPRQPSDAIYSNTSASNDFFAQYYFLYLWEHYEYEYVNGVRQSDRLLAGEEILTYEQHYVVYNVYSEFGLWTDALSIMGMVWLGNVDSNGVPVLHFLQGDITGALMTNWADRVDWAVNYLLPYYVSNDLSIPVSNIVSQGTYLGGSYSLISASDLTIPDEFTGISITPHTTGTLSPGTTYYWNFQQDGMHSAGQLQIQYYVTWGDGSHTGWINSLVDNIASDSLITLSHSYSSTGNFLVAAKLRFAFTPFGRGQSTAYSQDSFYYGTTAYVASSSSGGSSGGGGGGGGGGCVAQNTPILLANGKYKKVQSLKIGDSLMGYNYNTHQLTPVTLTNNTMTKVSELININNGFLKLTPEDQPIYIRNSTYVGWVINPQELKVGYQMFNPTTNTWISITSVTIDHGHFKVYDVRTSPFNNFIGNGVLLDIKVL